MIKVSLEEYFKRVRGLPFAFGEAHPYFAPLGTGSVDYVQVCPKCRGAMFDVILQADTPAAIKEKMFQVRKCQNCGQEYKV
jgi:hypothetical protein